MITHWNTGRLYQADGQRISAHSLADGTVLFNDHSRGIWGEFQRFPDAPAPATPNALRWLVMEHYDRNDYRMSVAASRLHWED